MTDAAPSLALMSVSGQQVRRGPRITLERDGSLPRKLSTTCWTARLTPAFWCNTGRSAAGPVMTPALGADPMRDA